MENIASRKLAQFFSGFRRLHYKKGETILRAEEESPGVFYLKRGYVRLYSLSTEGEELTLIIFRPKDIFPLMWVMTHTPNVYFLEAMTPVEICRSTKEEFLEFIKTNNNVFFELTGRILVRFGGLLSRMEYLVFGNAYNKVASILLICAERFGRKMGNQIEIQVPLIHKEVASLVGITRETASIELKKLEKRGMIRYRGRHIMIKDPQKLREESLFE